MPAGFQEQVVYSGLREPADVEFAPDGRVFVAQKNGVIKVSTASPTPRRTRSPTCRSTS
jgi:glucose/arabinose dehydrogenase